MDTEEIIRVLKRAIANIHKQKNNDALHQLHGLQINLERRIAENDREDDPQIDPEYMT